MYKTIFNKRNSLKFNRFSNKRYALFAVLGREVLVGALSVATLSHAKAAGVSTEGAKVDSTLYKGGKAYELDAVSVTGSRAPMTVEQSPKIVSVITRDDIHRAAAQTINDVLKLATGVDVRQRGGFGVQTDISINGGTFDQITILLNGVNISNPQTGHNASDFPVALADIDHIEVLEGAASRVFGTSAFNGAINIVTKKAKNDGVSANVEGGMRREEIVSGLGIADNGNLSRILEDLEHCGFIVRTNAYGARKYNAIYRLMDNFSLFFLKFMQENKTDDPSFWSHNYTSPLRYSWCGLAFERVCFQHIPQIKQALGISGVVTNTYSWQVKDDPVYGAGAQIDMLIERADNTVNICEMKFSQNEFVIDKDYDAVLRHKLSRFGASVSHRKAIHLTMVTTYGVVHNAYWNRVQSEVIADDLFSE
jgi:hypothetical protein